MPHLSPTTLTQSEQRLILRATAKHLRDHTIYSLALGTGLRLGEIVGLNCGDIFNGNGRPRTRIRIRREIAKRGKAGDVFLPDRLVAKLRRFRAFKKQRQESLEPDSPLSAGDSAASGNSKISLVGPNDVGHLEALAPHSVAEGQPAVSGRSSGLRVARSSLVDTCV